MISLANCQALWRGLWSTNSHFTLDALSTSAWPRHQCAAPALLQSHARNESPPLLRGARQGATHAPEFEPGSATVCKACRLRAASARDAHPNRLAFSARAQWLLAERLHAGTGAALPAPGQSRGRRGFCAGSHRKPPPNWYKRGAWIDASEIEKRMVDSALPVDAPSDAPRAAATQKEPETDVTKQLKALIKFRGGPITVAEYMRSVLLNPIGGFYSAHGGDAIGAKGHFITSPEILPLFGEMVAAWALATYQEMGTPEKFNLVELGPGRGTLMRQIVEAMKELNRSDTFLAAAELHLVEVSPDLRRMQHDALKCDESVTFGEACARAVERAKSGDSPALHTPTEARPLRYSDVRKSRAPGAPVAAKKAAPAPAASSLSDNLDQLVVAASDVDFALGLTDDVIVEARSRLAGARTSWHFSLNSVPDGLPSIIIAHEYLDALPVHQFVKDKERGWLEVLVNESTNPHDTRHLEFVLSPRGTTAVQSILKRRLQGLAGSRDKIEAIEVCPQAMAVAETAASRVGRHGGAALFIDYGKDGPYERSVNAIRHHATADVLQEPGKSDLTAWVDFDALRQAVDTCGANATVHGPIRQGYFLMAMGMEARLNMLLEKSGRSADECARLEDGFAQLVAGREHHPQGMGETFKAMVISPAGQPVPYPFNLDFEALTKS